MDSNPEPSQAKKKNRKWKSRNKKSNNPGGNLPVPSGSNFGESLVSNTAQSLPTRRRQNNTGSQGVSAANGMSGLEALDFLTRAPLVPSNNSNLIDERNSVNQQLPAITPAKKRTNRKKNKSNQDVPASSVADQNGSMSSRANPRHNPQRPPKKENKVINTPRHRPYVRHVDQNAMTFKEKLIYQLENNKYECMICFQNITPRQKVWSCKECYHVFHISGECILNWAKKSIEESGSWNCPACKAQYSQVPAYYCFCGKLRNPQTRNGDRPHACESLCLAKRGVGCVHPCNEPCHPGPCQECTAYVTKTCSCGKTTKSVRCGQSVECYNQCDKALSCGNHKCEKMCHAGDCAPCEVQLKQLCFCGREERSLECGPGLSSFDRFSCDHPCPLKYSCGIHDCANKCHDTAKGCGLCPTSVERITSCPCGQMSFEEKKIKRNSCLDPIPTCSNVCNKVLACGNFDHRCVAQCHNGDCPPCEDEAFIKCRCRKSKEIIRCSEVPSRTNEYNEILCKYKCQKRKSCGIHRCNERCCVSTDHTCLQLCRKKLSCGLHFCDYICHSGQCRPCLNASKCHTEEDCPPCTVLTEKQCYGGHEVRKNIQCHFSGISCGKPCGKQLSCGVHKCDRNCHPGECYVEGVNCTRPCPAVRSSCEHACAMPCHPEEDCPDTKCMQMVEVTCSCGRRNGKMKCYDMMASIIRTKAAAAQAEEGSEISEDNPTPGVLTRSMSVENMTCLSCNDDCKRVARNKKVAEALSIVTDEDGLTDEPTVTFTETLKDEFRKNPSFVHEVEATFCSLAKSLIDATVSDALSHSFRPMHIDRRRFIHNYAQLFCMTTVSVDDPPKRSVIVTARRSCVRVPLVLLTDLQKYPSLLKSHGLVTLKNTPTNDQIKKAEPMPEKGMQPLKNKCKVFKRIPIVISKPPPLKQQNFFSVLCSDNEEENNRVLNSTTRK
ncbi:unnamed protein product [Auanema sp. JU1783]|nr:unnamed protein product [Auanema sp. JU1783]